MNKIIKSGYVCEGIICESIDVDDKVFYLKKNGICYRYKRNKFSNNFFSDKRIS